MDERVAEDSASTKLEVEVVAAIDGEMPASVDEYSGDVDVDEDSGREDERRSVATSAEVAGVEDVAAVRGVDEDSEDVVDSTVPLKGVWRLCSR